MDYRFVSCQLRAGVDEAAQRYRLQGIAVRYGDTATVEYAPGVRETERLLPGCFGADVDKADVILRFQHERTMPLARTRGGGLVLRDSPEALTATASLPQTPLAHEVLGLVTAGVLRGISLGFFARETRRAADGANEVVRAVLDHVAIVDRPAYPESVVAAKRAALEARGIRTRREVKPGGQVWFL